MTLNFHSYQIEISEPEKKYYENEALETDKEWWFKLLSKKYNKFTSAITRFSACWISDYIT